MDEYSEVVLLSKQKSYNKGILGGIMRLRELNEVPGRRNIAASERTNRVVSNPSLL